MGGRHPYHSLHADSYVVAEVDVQLWDRDATLNTLKASLLQTQQLMADTTNKKQQDLNVEVGH